MRSLVVAGGVLAVVGLYWLIFLGGDQAGDGAPRQSKGAAIVSVEMPELTGQAKMGAIAFEGLCAGCHGNRADGIAGSGPPLIHKVYEPSHHGDFAFVRAAKEGVRSHHWPFGDMPPVDGITDAEISSIITYIRVVQQANGIN